MFASLELLLGTVVLRPYVFAFLFMYILAASAHVGVRGALVYIPLGYSLAWLSEYASIHWGIPYGDYYYILGTVGRELWVLGVPFMDSLSYVFLSYCSYSMAIFLLSPLAARSGQVLVLETRALRRSWETWVLGAFLFVLLDIIIDPVALQGHRWFLGQIYGYRTEGLYFGIPMSNFGGWLLVGFVLVGTLQLLDRVRWLEPRAPSILSRVPGMTLLGPVLYLCVLAFNLTVTFWIGETFMGLVGCLLLLYPLLLGFLFTLYKMRSLTLDALERHLRDFPAHREVYGSN
jgi:uncharacterized membrane protein